MGTGSNPQRPHHESRIILFRRRIQKGGYVLGSLKMLRRIEKGGLGKLVSHFSYALHPNTPIDRMKSKNSVLVMEVMSNRAKVRHRAPPTPRA